MRCNIFQIEEKKILTLSIQCGKIIAFIFQVKRNIFAGVTHRVNHKC